MDNETFDRKKMEIMENYPESFSHPEAQEGEIFLGSQLEDAVHLNAHLYRDQGVRSARVGTTQTFLEGSMYLPIFVNLRELLEHEERSAE